jgi:hypothetical protein
MASGKPVTTELKEKVFGANLLVTCSPFYGEDGELIGSVHIAKDITERIQRETERENLLAQLQEAMANVKMLTGLLPICASCKEIRDDEGNWTQIESYIRDRSEAEFSHSICPKCTGRLYPGLFDEDGKA